MNTNVCVLCLMFSIGQLVHGPLAEEKLALEVSKLRSEQGWVGFFSRNTVALLGIASFTFAVWQYRAKVRQDRADLVWRRHDATWALISEILQDKGLMEAFRILDYDGYEIEIPGQGRKAISSEDLIAAFTPPFLNGSPFQLHGWLRDERFDHLFHTLARIKRGVDTNHLDWADFATAFGTYLFRLRHGQLRSPVLGYLDDVFPPVAAMLRDELHYPLRL